MCWDTQGNKEKVLEEESDLLRVLQITPRTFEQ